MSWGKSKIDEIAGPVGENIRLGLGPDQFEGISSAFGWVGPIGCVV